MSGLEPILWETLSAGQRAACLRRPALARAGEVRRVVAEIVARVRRRGDAALRALTRELDGVELSELEVGAEDRQRARSRVAPRAARAIARAMRNIESFHRATRRPDIDHESEPGVACMRRTRAIARVGLYVPGGTAPLLSTALMLAVPARAAGCPLRVLCTPPGPGGAVDPHILLVAELAEVHRVFKVGGAQAIAAMAFGTESIPGVDKVFGPGNAFVTEAKLQCARAPGGAALDLPAGPSEVLIIADDSAAPGWVAADLLSQAEHDESSQVILVAADPGVAAAVIAELAAQLEQTARRAIARASLESNARVIVAAGVEQAVAISNQYAPEHLILQVARPRDWIDAITCAGSVFLGPFTPEAVGDYASGTNHVLPTYGYARAYSGLSLDAFEKAITFQELTPDGIRSLGPTVETLAALEGLEAHGRAVSLRLEALAGRAASRPPRGDS